jgi:hypothetical protein
MISLYDDGSIALIWSVGGFHAQLPFTVPSFMLERAAIDLTALIGAAARALNIDSGWSVQVGLTGSSIEILSQRWDRTWSVSTPIRQFKPVRMSIPPHAGDDILLASARDIALDCVNQAGIARLGVVRADD